MKRRSFLKLFSYSSVAGLAAHTGIYRSLASSRYYQHFGLSLPVPESWVSYSLENIIALQGRQQYRSLPDDDEYDETIYPLLVFSKYREPTEKMNPSIVIFGCELPEWHDEISLVEFAASLEDDYSRLVENHFVVEPTLCESLGGRESAKTVTSYLHRGTDGTSHQVQRTSYLLKSDKFVFLIFLTHSSGDSERADDVFRKFVREFRIS